MISFKLKNMNLNCITVVVREKISLNESCRSSPSVYMESARILGQMFYWSVDGLSNIPSSKRNAKTCYF